ncbi:MAG: DUF6328 family protein [Pseudonocardiaceae bacterium]
MAREAEDEESDGQHGAHLVAILFALMSMALMTAPAAWHRLLFRQRQRSEILQVSNGFTYCNTRLTALLDLRRPSDIHKIFNRSRVTAGLADNAILAATPRSCTAR